MTRAAVLPYTGNGLSSELVDPIGFGIQMGSGLGLWRARLCDSLSQRLPQLLDRSIGFGLKLCMHTLGHLFHQCSFFRRQAIKGGLRLGLRLNQSLPNTARAKSETRPGKTFLQTPKDLGVEASPRCQRRLLQLGAHLGWHSKRVRGLLFRFHPWIIDSF